MSALGRYLVVCWVAQIDDPLNSRHYNHVWELLKRYLVTPTDPISSISGSQTEDAATTTTESTPLALFFRIAVSGEGQNGEVSLTWPAAAGEGFLFNKYTLVS
jgi:hypothetical protein